MNNQIKSIFLLIVVFLATSCSNDDDNNPCANSTLAVTATAEEFTIIATATGGVAPYEYSIDGTTFQTSDTFEDVESGDYTITVRDANNCTSATSVSEAHLNSLLDERNGQRYKIVKIGDQIWLGENFNFDTNTATSTSSWCYDEESANCETYGKLYTWEAASQLPPEGWGLPTQEHWQTLFSEVENSTAELVNGEFQSLLGGARTVEGNFIFKGTYGYFWTSTPAAEGYHYFRFNETEGNGGVVVSDVGVSVRLIKLQTP
ncbi:FISUMP domain-containing protein [Gaetbulibacter jejuensis]